MERSDNSSANFDLEKGRVQSQGNGAMGATDSEMGAIDGETPPKSEQEDPDKASAGGDRSEEGQESENGEGTGTTVVPPVEGLSTEGKVFVLVAIAAWLGCFLGGILVDTLPFRKTISASGLEATIGDAAKDVIAYEGRRIVAVMGAYFFYTPTNLALLTLLSGLLGTLGRKASLFVDPDESLEADRINPKLSAMIRAFLVYLLFLSGVLVLADEPFSAPTPGSYLRLAGIMSLLSFVANYKPSFFAKILGGVQNFLNSKTPNREDA